MCKFNPTQDQMIRERNLNGESIQTLAGVFGVGRKAVVSVIARAGGGKDRTGSYTFSRATCDDLRRRHEAGTSAQDLALELRVYRSTISRAIRSAGGRLKQGPRPSPRIIDQSGYAKINVAQNDPLAVMGQRRKSTPGSSVYVLEHRLVLARKLGRALLANETVHHKDGNRLNNDPANLELRVGPHGKGATEAHCRTCTCFHGVN